MSILTTEQLKKMKAPERGKLKRAIAKTLREQPTATLKEVAAMHGVNQRYVEFIKKDHKEWRTWKCKNCGGPIRVRVDIDRTVIPQPYGVCHLCASQRFAKVLSERAAPADLEELTA